MDVVLDRPEEMNLLGLFMKAALEARADRVESAGPRGDIGMTAGRMSVTLCFEDGRVVVRKGIYGRPRAQVRGSLDALIQVARGRNAPILRRQARVAGNPLALIPLARVFKES